jgi:hypothetical protein
MLINVLSYVLLSTRFFHFGLVHWYLLFAMYTQCLLVVYSFKPCAASHDLALFRPQLEDSLPHNLGWLSHSRVPGNTMIVIGCHIQRLAIIYLTLSYLLNIQYSILVRTEILIQFPKSILLVHLPIVTRAISPRNLHPHPPQYFHETSKSILMPRELHQRAPSPP